MTRQEFELQEIENRKKFVKDTFREIGTNFISAISYELSPREEEQGKWCYIDIKDEEHATGMHIPLEYEYEGSTYEISEEDMNNMLQQAQNEMEELTK